MIRQFTQEDESSALEIHRVNELPDNCFPNLYIWNEQCEKVPNPLFMVKAVHQTEDGTPSMMAFVKITGEIFLLLSHEVGTPEQRWEWLKEFKEWVAQEAYRHGLEQISAFVPPEIEESFAKRLQDMGFQKSPYVCWTLNL